MARAKAKFRLGPLPAVEWGMEELEKGTMVEGWCKHKWETLTKCTKYVTIRPFSINLLAFESSLMLHQTFLRIFMSVLYIFSVKMPCTSMSFRFFGRCSTGREEGALHGARAKWGGIQFSWSVHKKSANPQHAPAWHTSSKVVQIRSNYYLLISISVEVLQTNAVGLREVED